MKKSGVSCLLMGGQACVLYGAAEFSRDVDLALLAESDNLERLREALDDLQAERIAVPPFERAFLEMGLAVHFRCRRPDVARMRVDVMSRMRGVDEFPNLWARRTTIELAGESLDLVALPDLVRAKKTQRDRDWPMIARLVEANYFQFRGHPSAEQVAFWLRELRSPSLLTETARQFPDECDRLSKQRRLLTLASMGDEAGLRAALLEEQELEQAADREYWQPLRAELERLRSMQRRRGS